MGTEDETELTLQGRGIAAAGAALVAACIVNPLDVIKTRIQAQAMAEASGQQQQPKGCSTPWTCTSTLYEHAAANQQHGLHHTHGLSDCHHHQHHHHHHQHHHTARPWLPQRHTHTLSPDAAWWPSATSCSSSSATTSARATASRLAAGSSGNPAAAGAAALSAAAAISAAARSAAADGAAAAAAAFRRWGITEGPLPIRRTPPFPVPYGWTPAPVTAAVNPAAAVAAAAASASAASTGILPATALAGAGAGACPQCIPGSSASAGAGGFVNSNSMWEMAKQIRAREGLPVLWRGTSASLLIAVPMVGIYMPLYDTLLDAWSSKLGSLAPVVSGTAARTAACFCVAPFELIRTRLQASVTAGVSMRSTLTSLVAEAPPAAAAAATSSTAVAAAAQPQIRPAAVLRAVPRMWTGFSATLVRDVPFSALYWALVEPLRQAMLPLNSHWPPLQQLDRMLHCRQPQQAGSKVSSSSVSGPAPVAAAAAVPPSKQHLMHHSQLEILIANMVSGFVAGGLAAGATTPFDVVKTRMQIASPSQQQQHQALGGGGGNGSSGSSRGIRVFNILRDVYSKEGVEGMFAGLKPRAARAAPACAIVISVYELLKSYLTPDL